MDWRHIAAILSFLLIPASAYADDSDQVIRNFGGELIGSMEIISILPLVIMFGIFAYLIFTFVLKADFIP